MHPAREIFPNHPLELVAVEIRYPFAPRLSRGHVIDSLVEALSPRWPNFEPIEQPEQNKSPDRRNSPLLRFVDRTYTSALSIKPASLTFETTRYSGFDDLLASILDIADVVLKNAHVHLLRRVGLRYLNEIRIPEIGDPREWQAWISPNLTGAVDLGGSLTPAGFAGIVHFSIAEYRHIVLQYGTIASVESIIREDVLRRRERSRGPFFLLDFDAFCQPPKDKTPQFDLDKLAQVLQELHDPTEEAFKSVISDKLLEVFRGRL